MTRINVERLEEAPDRPGRVPPRPPRGGLLVVVHPELPPAWLNSPIALRPQDVPPGPWRERVVGR